MHHNNSLPQAWKHQAFIVRSAIALSFLLIFTGCFVIYQPPPLEPLAGFYAKVEVKVTTSVTSHLQGDPGKQKLLKARLPSFERQLTMSRFIVALREVKQLSELAELIEAGVTFELRKPEHQEIRSNFNSPDVQRRVVAAIVQGMRRALFPGLTPKEK